MSKQIEGAVAPTMADRISVPYEDGRVAHFQFSRREDAWATTEYEKGCEAGDRLNDSDIAYALVRVGLRSIEGPDAASTRSESEIARRKTGLAAVRAIPRDDDEFWDDESIWPHRLSVVRCGTMLRVMMTMREHEGNSSSSQPAQTSGEDTTAHSASDNPSENSDGAVK